MIAHTELLALFSELLVLSLLTNGNAMLAVPEMRRMMVRDMGLLSNGQFDASIALGYSAPGPNVLFVAAIGYYAAGLTGALVVLAATLLPATLMAYAATHWGQRRTESRFSLALKAASAPVVIGLTFAAGWLLAARHASWVSAGVAAAAALLMWRTRTHVLLLIGLGAALGAAGWI